MCPKTFGKQERKEKGKLHMAQGKFYKVVIWLPLTLNFYIVYLSFFFPNQQRGVIIQSSRPVSSKREKSELPFHFTPKASQVSQFQGKSVPSNRLH